MIQICKAVSHLHSLGVAHRGESRLIKNLRLIMKLKM